MLSGASRKFEIELRTVVNGSTFEESIVSKA